MKNILILFVLCSFGLLPAQTRLEMDFSGNSVKFSDLGSKGVVISSYQEGSVGMAMFTPDGQKLWEQTVEFKRVYSYAGCGSPDGTVFYMLVNAKGKAKGSGDGYTICRINVVSGEMETKEHVMDKKSNPISSYATNTAFYLVTSPQAWDYESKNAYTTDLMRFDRNTLNYTVSTADMNIEYADDKMFWEFYKVEQSYVEGYRIVSQEMSTVEIEFARFDSTGKKVFSKMTDLKLLQGVAVPTNTSEKTYKSIANFVLIHTHSYSTNNGFRTAVVDLMSLVHLLYDDETKTMLLYGITGPEVWKNNNAKYEGYFVAKLDADYQVVSTLERSKESVITQTVLNSGMSKDQRYCDGFIHPDNRFGLIFGGLKTDLHAIVDLNTMTQKSFTRVEMKYSGNGNCYLPADLQKMLLNNVDVIKEGSRYSGSALFCNHYMQLVCIHPYSSSTSTVFVEKQ